MFVRAGWDENKPTPFAIKGRNAEDLGVEIFSKSPVLNFSFPIITENWALTIEPGDESPCSYDWSTYRYCAQLKTVIRSSSNPKVLKPTMAFTVTAACGDASEQTSGSAGVAIGLFGSSAVRFFVLYGDGEVNLDTAQRAANCFPEPGIQGSQH